MNKLVSVRNGQTFGPRANTMLTSRTEQLPQAAGGTTPSLTFDLLQDISSERRLTQDEAVELIGRIHREMESVEDRMLRLRWYLGVVLNRIEKPYGTGERVIEGIISALWSTYEIRANRTLLYECKKLVSVFSGELRAFERWITQQKNLLHRPVHWNDVQRLCLGGRNNPQVIGREEADQRDYRDAEKGIEALERIMVRARQGEEEAQGVIEGARQSIAGMLLLPRSFPTTPRSDEYLAFVRSHPCAVCASPAESHHAFGRRGFSLKSSDFTCVALCHAHHVELHQGGRSRFEAMHEIDLIEVAFNLLHRYLTGAWATMMLAGDGRR